jgi:hypothetical protein
MKVKKKSERSQRRRDWRSLVFPLSVPPFAIARLCQLELQLGLEQEQFKFQSLK